MKKMTKTLEYISKYCKDEKCRQNVEKEISNYLEGRKFTWDKINSGFYEIYKECIDNPVNEWLTVSRYYWMLNQFWWLYFIYFLAIVMLFSTKNHKEISINKQIVKL